MLIALDASAVNFAGRQKRKLVRAVEEAVRTASREPQQSGAATLALVLLREGISIRRSPVNLLSSELDGRHGEPLNVYVENSLILLGTK